MPGGSSAPLLSVQSLSLWRGERSLCVGLSFELSGGEVIQIEGANGAGKTSLLRVLAGLSRYSYSGRVETRAPLLYIGHQAAVKALLTPRENLRYHVSGRLPSSDEDIDAALDAVGLYGFEETPAHQLSAGQQRRINLARLFLEEGAPLWLLDEPYTAIDVAGVAALDRRIESHVQSGGAAVIVSHQPVGLQCDVTPVVLREVSGA